MDIKEYISSGIIEAYVMGFASEEEISILDCVRKNNPEVQQAIIDAQETLEDFATREAIAPPPALKSAIWAKISDENREQPITETQQPETIATPLYPTQSIDNSKATLKWFAAAASVLLIASISLNFYLNHNKNSINAQLAALSQNQKTTDLAYQNLKSKWDMASNPGVRTIPLLGVEKHPDMKAMVYFEQNSNAVYLTLENLPMAPKDQQYQLWAIVEGKPVSLGVYDQNSEKAMQQMIAVSAAQAFAITLEKRGGVASPTMENMYVMGKV